MAFFAGKGSGLEGFVLAGGKSSRMGSDKALLEWEGVTLLERQTRLLWKAGAKTVRIVSGETKRYGPDCLPDRWAGAGPLGGIATALEASEEDLVLIVPVDLPFLNEAVLNNLLATCSGGCGAVSRIGNKLEPLVAVYPKRSAVIASERLSSGRLAARGFAEECVAAGLCIWCDFLLNEEPFFANWNRPEDVRPSRAALH